jgi:hypothetical protein
MTNHPDARQYAPATERNREAILAVLQEILPPTGTVLEISSGTGEHAVYFAPRLYPRHWIPSDPNPIARDSIAAWQAHFPAENLHPPLDINVTDEIWSIKVGNYGDVEPIKAIANINMIHIAPWQACLGLIAGGRRILRQGGILYLYGPFKQGREHTAPSNEAFDASLRAQNPEWGVRDIEEVVAVAERESLKLIKTVAMPANNLSVIFQVS